MCWFTCARTDVFYTQNCAWCIHFGIPQPRKTKSENFPRQYLHPVDILGLSFLWQKTHPAFRKVSTKFLRSTSSARLHAVNRAFFEFFSYLSHGGDDRGTLILWSTRDSLNCACTRKSLLPYNFIANENHHCMVADNAVSYLGITGACVARVTFPKYLWKDFRYRVKPRCRGYDYKSLWILLFCFLMMLVWNFLPKEKHTFPHFPASSHNILVKLFSSVSVYRYHAQTFINKIWTCNAFVWNGSQPAAILLSPIQKFGLPRSPFTYRCKEEQSLANFVFEWVKWLLVASINSISWFLKLQVQIFFKSVVSSMEKVNTNQHLQS